MNEKQTRVRIGPRQTGENSATGPTYSSTIVEPVMNFIRPGSCSTQLVWGCLT